MLKFEPMSTEKINPNDYSGHISFFGKLKRENENLIVLSGYRIGTGIRDEIRFHNTPDEYSEICVSLAFLEKYVDKFMFIWYLYGDSSKPMSSMANIIIYDSDGSILDKKSFNIAEELPYPKDITLS